MKKRSSIYIRENQILLSRFKATNLWTRRSLPALCCNPVSIQELQLMRLKSIKWSLPRKRLNQLCTLKKLNRLCALKGLTKLCLALWPLKNKKKSSNKSLGISLAINHCPKTPQLRALKQALQICKKFPQHQTKNIWNSNPKHQY